MSLATDLSLLLQDHAAIASQTSDPIAPKFCVLLLYETILKGLQGYAQGSTEYQKPLSPDACHMNSEMPGYISRHFQMPQL